MNNHIQYNCPRDLYVYVDETGNDGVSTQIGYGFFITHQNYDELVDIIGQAKSKCNMAEDDFFHASNDSDIKRECLLSEINNSLSGEFFAIFESKAKEFDNKKSSINKVFKKLLRGLFPKFAFSPLKITIIIEKKQGINSCTIEEITKNFVEYSRLGQVKFISYSEFLIRQCNKKPKIKQYFNVIKSENSNKGNAGCQIVDFLLWAYVRNNSGKDTSKFYDRIDKKIPINSFAMGLCDRQEHINSIDYIIGLFDKNSMEYPIYDIRENLEILNNELADLYIFIENTVENIILLPSIPSNIIHHECVIIAVKNLINDARSGCEFNIADLIRNVCKVFLYLFDTLPLYRQQDDLLWWLKAKSLASCLYFKERIELKQFYNSNMLCLSWVYNNKCRAVLHNCKIAY